MSSAYNSNDKLPSLSILTPRCTSLIPDQASKPIEPSLHLPVDATNPSDWEYVNEGQHSIIFHYAPRKYHSKTSFLRYRVLKLEKSIVYQIYDAIFHYLSRRNLGLSEITGKSETNQHQKGEMEYSTLPSRPTSATTTPLKIDTLYVNYTRILARMSFASGVFSNIFPPEVTPFYSRSRASQASLEPPFPRESLFSTFHSSAMVNTSSSKHSNENVNDGIDYVSDAVDGLISLPVHFVLGLLRTHNFDRPEARYSQCSFTKQSLQHVYDILDEVSLANDDIASQCIHAPEVRTRNAREKPPVCIKIHGILARDLSSSSILESLQLRWISSQKEPQCGFNHYMADPFSSMYLSSIEIKPKQGYISNFMANPCELLGLSPSLSSSFRPPPSSTFAFIRENVCRYCIQQVKKVQTGKVSSLSHYCPLDLYSVIHESESRAVLKTDLSQTYHSLVQPPVKTLESMEKEKGSCEVPGFIPHLAGVVPLLSGPRVFQNNVVLDVSSISPCARSMIRHNSLGVNHINSISTTPTSTLACNSAILNSRSYHPSRVRQALESLLETPQNNFRIRTLALNCESDDQTNTTFTSLRKIPITSRNLLPGNSSFVGKTSEAQYCNTFCDSFTHILKSNPVASTFSRLRSVSKALDPLAIEGVHPFYVALMADIVPTIIKETQARVTELHNRLITTTQTQLEEQLEQFLSFSSSVDGLILSFFLPEFMSLVTKFRMEVSDYVQNRDCHDSILSLLRIYYDEVVAYDATTLVAKYFSPQKEKKNKKKHEKKEKDLEKEKQKDTQKEKQKDTLFDSQYCGLPRTNIESQVWLQEHVQLIIDTVSSFESLCRVTLDEEKTPMRNHEKENEQKHNLRETPHKPTNLDDGNDERFGIENSTNSYSLRFVYQLYLYSRKVCPWLHLGHGKTKPSMVVAGNSKSELVMNRDFRLFCLRVVLCCSVSMILNDLSIFISFIPVPKSMASLIQTFSSQPSKSHSSEQTQTQAVVASLLCPSLPLQSSIVNDGDVWFIVDSMREDGQSKNVNDSAQEESDIFYLVRIQLTDLEPKHTEKVLGHFTSDQAAIKLALKSI